MAKKQVRLTHSIAEEALVRIMRVGDRLWRESDVWFRRWELTDNHYNVLRILNGSGEPLRQVEIGRRMLSSRANVTKVVDHLEALGLVRRLTCQDRRVNLVDLTDAGLQFLEETASEVVAFADASLGGLTREEQRTLNELLGKLLE
ncbi:MAG: MarR family winged helix-turn-helix transcriptional regulator [Blastocatellia bacterium]|jgi:DNA-binding MarR family transcriptional regulator